MTLALTTVVWLPEFSTTAYTLLRSLETARARASLPNRSILIGGFARFPGSNTLTAFSCDTATNARPPAKTTSAGSSPTGSVLTVVPRLRSTMLIVSERWLTTHASESLLAATLTGSSPTGIEAQGARPPPGRTVKTSSSASGVLTTRSLPPAGVRAIGWTCDDSKLTYWARAVPHRTRPDSSTQAPTRFHRMLALLRSQTRDSLPY